MPPSNFEDEYVLLICPQCGGNVRVDAKTLDQHYTEMGDGTALYMGTIAVGGGASCESCGSKFAKKEKVKIDFDGRGSLQINTGGVYIGGDASVEGDVVGRDKVTIVNSGTGSVAVGGVAAGAGGVAIGGSARFCTECGAVNPGKAKFCQECGHKF